MCYNNTTEDTYTRSQMREGLQSLVEQTGEDLVDADVRADLLSALKRLPTWMRVVLVMHARGYTLRYIDWYIGASKPHPEHAKRLLTRAEDMLLAFINGEQPTNGKNLSHRTGRRRKDDAG